MQHDWKRIMAEYRKYARADMGSGNKATKKPKWWGYVQNLKHGTATVRPHVVDGDGAGETNVDPNVHIPGPQAYSASPSAAGPSQSRQPTPFPVADGSEERAPWSRLRSTPRTSCSSTSSTRTTSTSSSSTSSTKTSSTSSSSTSGASSSSTSSTRTTSSSTSSTSSSSTSSTINSSTSKSNTSSTRATSSTTSITSSSRTSSTSISNTSSTRTTSSSTSSTSSSSTSSTRNTSTSSSSTSRTTSNGLRK
ncbi:unnamed protein product [Closterium sp. NIES-53]